MKIYTSYFYQVRFMKPYMIPLSTAIWDPKWFHNFKGQDNIFVDKNGVVNGLRATPFAPVVHGEAACTGQPCDHKPESCAFLKQYLDQLNKLDINEIVTRCNNLGQKIKQLQKFEEEPEFIFLVHEAPQNLCSERAVIQLWFKQNGFDVTEWHK